MENSILGNRVWSPLSDAISVKGRDDSHLPTKQTLSAEDCAGERREVLRG